MGKIAFYNRFLVTLEIVETFQSIGREVVIFQNADELSNILKEEKEIDFVMEIDFHDFVWSMSVEYDLPYISWSFDSGIRETILPIGYENLRDKDFLFLFNSLDYEECSEHHKNTYYLPFSASESFFAPVRKEDFEYEILIIMNSYYRTKNISENVFERLYNSEDELQQKSLELCKSLMELVVEKHIDIVDRFCMIEILNKYIKDCGVDPFNDKKKESFCYFYGQILSFEQRVKCIKELCLSGFRVDVFGDDYLKDILAKFPNARFHPNAQYHELSALYNKAKINVNLTQVQFIDSVPQRIYHLLNSGAFLLTNYSEELDKLFKTSVHLESFKNFEEMTEKVNYYMKNEDERIKIAESGQKEFLDKHRMKDRLLFICSKVENY
jgi:spore maturation protein CgeB